MHHGVALEVAKALNEAFGSSVDWVAVAVAVAAVVAE